jgi:hypothetical protein
MPADWDPTLPVYQIGQGQFLIDDRAVDYSFPGFQRPWAPPDGVAMTFSSQANALANDTPSLLDLASDSGDTNSSPVAPTLELYTGEGIPDPGFFYSMSDYLPPTPFYPLTELLPLYTDGLGDYYYADTNLDAQDFWALVAAATNAGGSSSVWLGGGSSTPSRGRQGVGS